MLLMTRRVGEGLVINGTIEIKILEVRGGRIKIGCEFPPGNTVYRNELFEKIQAENQAAAKASLGAGTAVALTGALAGLTDKTRLAAQPTGKEPTHAQRSTRHPTEKPS